MKKKVKYLVMDVDGTLTDGKIYMSASGEEFKVFNVKDGYGITKLLKENNIEPIIITGRTSKILERRCEELEIQKLYQGVEEKLKLLLQLLEYEELGDIAYIGDDLNDLACMEMIKKNGGLISTPQDGACELKKISDYVCAKCGGEGAVREFIEWMI